MTLQPSTSDSNTHHRPCGCLGGSVCTSDASHGVNDSGRTESQYSGGGAHDGRLEASHQASTSGRDSIAGYAWTLPADTSSKQCVWLWVRS